MTTDPAAAAGDQTGQGAPAAQAADPWADPAAARTEIEKLRREAAAHRVRVRELEPLAAQATAAQEAQKTETQRLSEQLAAAQRQAADAQITALRFQVAADKKLPAQFAGRLQGSTAEELAADADQLAELLGLAGTQQGAQNAQGARPAVDLRQGTRGTAAVQPQDPNQWLRDLARKGGRLGAN